MDKPLFKIFGIEVNFVMLFNFGLIFVICLTDFMESDPEEDEGSNEKVKI